MEKNQLQSCIVKDVKKGNNHTSTELSVNKPVVKNFILHALTNDSINIATRKSAFINQTANHEIIVSGPIVPIDGKDINFENEEEWDIGGIPELLNELDADIEKSLEYCNESSLKDNHDTSFTRGGLTISINDWISKNDGHSLEKRTCIKSVNELIGHNSTFPGYSKGGHLYSPISTSPNKVYTILKDTSSADTNWNSYKRDLSHSMSSQGGNLHSGTGNNAVSGGISNVSNNNQSGTQGNSNKSNSKMSIDHQATLDKGLKMKIKRTKPGTKTSEAKHEIVKATEQLQNGVAVNASIKEESSSAIPGSNPVPSTSQSNFGNSPTQNNALGVGSKKITGNSSSQMGNNFPCGASGGSNGAASSLISNISNVSSSASNKRSSSGHRREKMKEKTSHSIRTVSDKNISVNSEKDFTDKNVCNCSINDSTSTVCSSAICNRGNDGSTHRLSNPNLNSSVVPPGVFIPSSDSSSSASPLLSVSPAVSNSAVATHSSTINGSANTPGPPGKEPANSNIKISSHIAAQLAAVAASGTNNSDIKHPTANASSGLSKQSPHSNSIPVPLCKSNTSTAPLLLPIPPTTDENVKSPPAKRAKTDCSINENNTIAKETVDICVGTSIGTITEPDCLGPCEPGTSVTLEGIVWHETEGGVLVVNVTWRGKTYVGTLLDCTRHDWAPPRFCDSPSDELDSRTHKGRGKRGRGVPTPDLSNFTETRSSIYFSHPHVHSKLRNGSVKGSRGNSRTSNAAERNNGGSSISSGTGGSTPSTSPTAFLPPRREKRKSKDEPSSPTNVDSDSSSGAMVNASGIPISASGGAFASQPQSLINPVTGLNVQISTKRCKTAVPCALSPVLLECPEHDCSKKYKHANGLRYHQSHAHGNLSIADDDSVADIDETHITPLNSPGIVSIPAESEELGNFSALMIVEPSALKISDSTKTKLPHTEVVLSAFDLDKASRAEADLTPSAMSTDLLNAVNKSVLNMSAEISNMGKDTGEPDDKKTGDNTILPSAEDVDSSSQSPSSKRSLRFTPSDTKHSDSGLLERDETSNLNHSESSSSLSEQLDSKTHSRTTIPLVSKDDDQSSPQGVKPDTIKINTDSCLSNPDKVIEINCKSPSNTASSKPKKGRKSPPITGLDVDEFKRCNIASREEVQSPAYSDISDDSTSVNDQQQIEKLHSTKSVDVNKKSQDIVMTTGSVCPSGSQPSMTSPLSGYGMYQFYQQQQFLLQSSIDQQSSKNNLATNMVQPVIPSSQQSANSTESSRKEPPLDLITKPIPPTLQQIASPSSQDSEKEAIPPQGNVSSSATGGLSSSATSKPISHFYAFNYVSPSYQFNVDQNYAPLPVNAEEGKGNRHLGILSPSEQQQPITH
ncbi:uncharacterized protein LOC142239792 [Haematobia irritans]|uniref:uncharacterized protein LOC142239792 n=1 Tax=Haematobia irritans TaxID=7368 RepID=UPI003F4F6027